MCIAMFESTESFNLFADAQIADHPAVGRYEPIFVRRRVKFGAAIPL